MQIKVLSFGEDLGEALSTMLFNTITNFIAGSIFNGTFTITICLFIVKLFKIELFKINKPALVKAVNTVLLLGANIYLVTYLAEIFTAYYSGGEYEQYTFTNRLFGSYWWAALALLIRSLLLPQILWIGKFRKSFIATIVILSFWVLINIFSMIPFGAMEILREFKVSMGYFEGLVIYIVILAVVYFILNRKKLIESKYTFTGS